MDDEKHWHLDKRIPLAMLLAFGVYTATMIWWAATLQAQVTVNANETTKNAFRVTQLETQMSAQNTSLSVLLSQMQTVTNEMARLREEISQTNQIMRQALVNQQERMRGDAQ